ncbi:Variant Ionotropic Glutamate Receptor [Penaeus vannamei]|uniref:Variant Ionotropic Glutamate Receptor n=1 Tax=Penaeus vannamei TaxID=6689 RepID=A0A3R7MMD5_PENVA|nr:Variant Ionotropic Glutamate Receptor [Penaeus vannamei]
MAGEPPNHRVSGPLVQIMEIIGDHLQTCVEFVIPADNKYGSQLPNGTWTGVIEMVRRRVSPVRFSFRKTVPFYCASDSSLSFIPSDTLPLLPPSPLQSVIPSDILPLPPSLSVALNQLFPLTYSLSHPSLSAEANMSGVTLSIDAPRAEVVDFSVPLFMDEHILTYRRPVYESDLLGFIKPYTAQHNAGPGEAQAGAKQTVQGHLWSSAYLTLALLLGQSVPRLPSASALRVMAGVWLLSALIVSSVYRSNLKAMLILPKLRLPFDSMDELLEANIPTYVADGTMLYQKMMVSPPDSFLGRLRAQTVTYLDTPRAIRELLLGRHATFASRAIGQSVIHQIFEQTKTCPLYTAKERFWGATSVALAFPKGSPLKPKIDKIFRRLTEFGIPEYLHQKQIRHERKCQMDDFTRPSDALRPLALGDFYGVFIVYVGGHAVSPTSAADSEAGDATGEEPQPTGKEGGELQTRPDSPLRAETILPDVSARRGESGLVWSSPPSFPVGCGSSPVASPASESAAEVGETACPAVESRPRPPCPPSQQELGQEREQRQQDACRTSNVFMMRLIRI